MRFEWDPDKERANIRKHGVDFATASEVFDDEKRIEFYDAKHSIHEERYITIGKVGAILFVVFTERNELLRLISARPATKSERRQYYDGYF